MASGATSTYGLPYPLQTDPVDVATDAQLLATQVETQLLLKAALASPTFTGVPAAPTASNSDNSTQIATTAFVKNQSYLTTTTASSTYAPLASPNFTGTPQISSVNIATTANITTHAAVASAVHGVAGTIVGTTDTQTLTNKTIDGTTNTLQNVPQSAVTGLAATISGLSANYFPLNTTINAQTGTAYTLVVSDAAKAVEMNNAAANTVTVPTNATAAFPVGTQITIIQTGAGQTTIAAAGGVTINAQPGLKIVGQWRAATLLKRATDSWVLMGALTA